MKEICVLCSSCFRAQDEPGQSALESPRSTLVEEIQEGSVEEVAWGAGLGSEECRVGEAGWKEASIANRNEQE